MIIRYIRVIRLFGGRHSKVIYYEKYSKNGEHPYKGQYRANQILEV